MSHARLFFGFDEKEVSRSVREALRAIDSRFLHEYGKERAIGIDEVRGMQHKALLSAGESTQSFIIYRADEMTREAHNAFLKLLEEPPRGSFFFLAAKSIAGIPATTLSRVEKIAVAGMGGVVREVSGDLAELVRERDDAIHFFEDEIGKLKQRLEEESRKRTLDHTLLERISLCMRLLDLLHMSRTSPRYIMDRYTLGMPNI